MADDDECRLKPPPAYDPGRRAAAASAHQGGGFGQKDLQAQAAPEADGTADGNEDEE